MIVAIPKTAEELDNEARSIAAMIAETQVGQREELFRRVAYHLKYRYAQGFSATLFEKLASVS